MSDHRRHHKGPRVEARLTAWSREAARRSLAARVDLDVIADALRTEGLEPLLVKGPAVARELYPEAPAARSYGDLDLLVRPAEVSRAHEVLTRLGYRCSGGLPTELLEAFVGVGEELAYEHTERIVVDLHWRLYDRSLGPDFAEWARRRMRRLPELPLPVLSLEDTLLYLAVHGGKHGWSHLYWLADLARLVIHPQVDWARVEAAATVTHTRRLLDLGRLRMALNVVFTPTVYEWQRWRLPPLLFSLYAVPRVGRLLRKYLLGQDV